MLQVSRDAPDSGTSQLQEAGSWGQVRYDLDKGFFPDMAKSQTPEALLQTVWAFGVGWDSRNLHQAPHSLVYCLSLPVCLPSFSREHPWERAQHTGRHQCVCYFRVMVAWLAPLTAPGLAHKDTHRLCSSWADWMTLYPTVPSPCCLES